MMLENSGITIDPRHVGETLSLDERRLIINVRNALGIQAPTSVEVYALLDNVYRGKLREYTAAISSHDSALQSSLNKEIDRLVVFMKGLKPFLPT